MKKLLILSLLIVFLFIPQTMSVKAQGPGGAAVRSAKPTTKPTTINSTQLGKTQTRAMEFIDNRIDNLTKLTGRIQEDKKMSENDKTQLNKEVQDEVTGLTNLKTKIQNDGILADLRTDAKKIVSDYKVYAIFEPKIRLLIVINNLQEISSNTGTSAARIQTAIDKLKAEGQNVLNLQTLLADVNKNLDDINTRLTTDKTTVLGLTPTSINARIVFTTTRKDLAAVRTDFAKIRADIARMRNQLSINIKKGSVAPKPTKP